MGIFLLRIFLSAALLLNFQNSFSQNSSSKEFIKWTTWALLQTIPSPTFYQDSNEDNSRLQFGLKWNVVPVNYSFSANRLVSPVQFFLVNPVRRNSGSLEIFVEPEWATANFKYADLKRFNLSTGARVFIPAVEYGEYLSFSVGGKYNFRKNNSGGNNNFSGVEGGVYTFFGIAGLVFDYNFISQSRYSISLNLKYY